MPINFPSPATEGQIHPDTAGKDWLFQQGAWGGAVEVPIAADPTPLGLIAPFGGATLPSGWLLCDGAEISRATYPDLFAVIGETYGVGDGSTTFSLPDYSSKVAGGSDATNIHGTAKGAEAVSILVDNLPAHSHTATFSGGAVSGTATGTVEGQTGGIGDHSHTYNSADGIINDAQQGGPMGVVHPQYSYGKSTGNGGSHSHSMNGTLTGGTISGTATGTVTVNPIGGDAPLNVVQPTLYSPYMIKALFSTADLPAPITDSPTGLIAPFGGLVAPAGWLDCDGSAIDRTVFADLYAAIGDTYGAGDGSTTFNVPDYRDRAAAGSSTTNVSGSNKGSETITMTVAQLPSHGHTASFSGGAVSGTATGTLSGQTSNGGGHSHTVPYAAASVIDDGGQPGYRTFGSSATSAVADHSHSISGTITGGTISGTATGTVTVNASGTGDAINVLSPVLYSNYIIKV